MERSVAVTFMISVAIGKLKSIFNSLNTLSPPHSWARLCVGTMYIWLESRLRAEGTIIYACQIHTICHYRGIIHVHAEKSAKSIGRNSSTRRRRRRKPCVSKYLRDCGQVILKWDLCLHTEIFIDPVLIIVIISHHRRWFESWLTLFINTARCIFG